MWHTPLGALRSEELQRKGCAAAAPPQGCAHYTRTPSTPSSGPVIAAAAEGHAWVGCSGLQRSVVRRAGGVRCVCCWLCLFMYQHAVRTRIIK